MAGTDHEGFKIPSAVPQDILLIQDLIGLIPPTHPLTLSAADPDHDSVDSSGESTDSAEEVEANLLFMGGKSRRSVLYFMQLPVTNVLLARIPLVLPLLCPPLRPRTLRVRAREMYQKNHL